MNVSSVNHNSNRFLFMRNDGEAIIFNGRNPEDAWENLCDSYDNDSHYITRYFNLEVNESAISKGFQWLNNNIRGPLNQKYKNADFGPVFKSI